MTDNINSAHGKEQNIKMNLLKWLNEGKDPYSIIYELANILKLYHLNQVMLILY